MNVSIKTKFTVIIVFMIIVSMIFAYVISNEVVLKIVNKNFELALSEKRDSLKAALEDTARQLKKEGKFLSYDRDLNYFLSGGYLAGDIEADSENGKFIRFYEFTDRRQYYYRLKTYYKSRLKEHFNTDDGIDINIIDKNGAYIYENTPGYYDDSDEIERALGKKDGSPKELSLYLKDREGDIFLREYYPVFSKKTGEVIGVLTASLKLDENFLKFLKISEKDNYIILDEKFNPKIATFEDWKEKLRWRKNGEFEFDGDIYEFYPIEIKDSIKTKIGYIGVALNKTDMYNSISEVSAYLFIALLFVFALIFIVSTSVLSVLVDSIKELTIKINSLREGNFTLNLKNLKNRNDEIGILAEEFEDMVHILKNKIEIMEKIGIDNKKNAEKLGLANNQLAENKRELEEKNINIDRINKMLNSRITEITNLYYLIVNISKYIADDRFYSIVVRGIREGLHIRNVIVFENENGILQTKAKAGTPENIDGIELTDDIKSVLSNNEIIRITKTDIMNKWKIKNIFKVPYIIPIRSIKEGENEIYGAIIVDNDSEFDEESLKAITTYCKTIMLAFENRKLYMKLLFENEKLEKTTKRLMESEKLKNIFLANVSHELKVPLVPIKGYSELMLDGILGDISVSQRRALIVGINNIERLQDIIENILSYSRIESGKYELINKNFNIAEAIKKAIEHLDVVIEKKDIKIIEEFEEEESIVFGDKEAIAQVFINILSNSVKFSQQEGSVKISVKSDKADYKIIIEDNGVGMDSEKVSMIFESFKQLEDGNTRKYGGIGLGLTVAQRILEYYGKTFEIESSPGRGTKIIFSLQKRRY